MPSPYYGIPDLQYLRCKAIGDNAAYVWTNLVSIVRAENLALGITTSGKTKLIADAFFPVMVYGSTGSLWEAFNQLDHIVITPEMAPFITRDRIQWMKNQLIQSISSL